MSQDIAESSRLVPPPSGWFQTSVREWGGPALLLLISLLVFIVAKHGLMWVTTLHSSPFWLVVATFLFAAATSSIRYRVMADAPRIILRSIAMMVLFQVACEAFGAVYGAPNLLFSEGPDLLFFRYGALIALIAGVLSWYRPSFAICLIVHYVLFRERISANGSIPIVRTDYMNMTDVALFLVIGTLCTVALTRSERFAALRGSLPDFAALREKAFLLLWAGGVGAHLGNYFWSGVAKLEAGQDRPFTWLFENPTQTAIVIGLERGDNPLAMFPHVLQFVWDAIIFMTPVINPLVLGFQCLVIFASINRRTLLTFTIAFDLFHVVVYFTLGAIFQFWVFVNILVFASVLTIPKEKFTNAIRVVMFIFTIWGNYVFYTSHLGWLDGAKIAAPNVYAETKDGRRVLMPAVFFGIFSYTINQTQAYIPPGNFKQTHGGNHKNLADFYDAQVCGPKVMGEQKTGVSLQAMQNLIRNADRFMRDHPAVKNYNLYYLYPHHMLPNPPMFSEFNKLTMEDIVGYYYVVDSVCLSLKDGKLHRDIRKHWEIPVAISKP
jgi:hypothetical protein